MKLLALDTSTERMALALVTPQQVWLHEAAGGAAASTTLIPAALALLAEAGLSLAALDALAVGQGPGAFTGLRTAVSVVQGLALGAGKPVLLLDSLLLVAQDAHTQALAAGAAPQAAWPVWVAMDARMDEVYAAAYRHTPELGWTCTHAPALWDVPSLAACWLAEPPQAVAGSALAAFGERLPVGAATCWPQTDSRAAALGRLAQAAWQAGAAVPPEQALPLYLRDKVAQTTAEREAARQSAAAASRPQP